MHYVARVVAVFPEGTVYPNELDAWDAVVILEAGSTRGALQKAVSISRSTFEESGNLKDMGYSTKPLLYVVASICEYHNVSNRRKVNPACGIVITSMMSLSRNKVRQLEARHDISVSLRALFVVENGALRGGRQRR